jgi:DNA ligase (NAD+)
MNNKELSKLIDLVDAYDDAYYNKDEPIVDDLNYDQIKSNLFKAVEEFKPKTKADEKVRDRANEALTRVGAPPPSDSKWEKVVHEVPMQSLNKAHTPADLETWARDCGAIKT